MAKDTQVNNYKALEHFSIDKENFESYLNTNLETKLTDEQWLLLADVIDGRVANYLDEILEQLAEEVSEGLWD
jgi:hypothetical protein